MRVIIHNFLHWAHLELEFHPEITLLKGPSGWGKSTVFQAICWALYRRGSFPTLQRGVSYVLLRWPDWQVYRQRHPGLVRVSITGQQHPQEYLDRAAEDLIQERAGPVPIWLASSYLDHSGINHLLTISQQERANLLLELSFTRDHPAPYLTKLHSHSAEQQTILQGLELQYQQQYAIFHRLWPSYQPHGPVGNCGDTRLRELQEEVRRRPQEVTLLQQHQSRRATALGVRQQLQERVTTKELELAAVVSRQQRNHATYPSRRSPEVVQRLWRLQQLRQDIVRLPELPILASTELWTKALQQETLREHGQRLAQQCGLPYQEPSAEISRLTDTIQRTQQEVTAYHQYQALVQRQAQRRAAQTGLAGLVAPSAPVWSGDEADVTCPTCQAPLTYRLGELVTRPGDGPPSSGRHLPGAEETNQTTTKSSGRPPGAEHHRAHAVALAQYEQQLRAYHSLAAGYQNQLASLPEEEVLPPAPTWPTTDVATLQRRLAALRQLTVVDAPLYSSAQLQQQLYRQQLQETIRELLSSTPDDVPVSPLDLENAATWYREDQQCQMLQRSIQDTLRELTSANQGDVPVDRSTELLAAQQSQQASEQLLAHLTQDQAYWRDHTQLTTLYQQLLAQQHRTMQHQQLLEIAVGTENQELARTVSQLNQLLTKLAESLFPEELRVSLQLQRSSRQGTTRPSVELTVEEDGGERDYLKTSFGQRDRLSLALTLALCLYSGSRCLLLDESFCHLDASTKHDCLETVKDHVQKYCNYIIITAQDTVEGYYDRVIDLATCPPNARQ
jgi:DNA repair exonuclease SbcCD ATPase subunit